MEGLKVELYVYDLSNGLAATMSRQLLGIQVDGIWHTSIVVRGTEFYFGGGISVARAGTTAFGRPVKIINLGQTFLPMEIIHDLVNDLRHRFSETSYSLLDNNCNNFTDELAKLLVGTGIPDEIVKLPENVMATPFGRMMRPMLAGLESRLGSVSEAPPVTSAKDAPPVTSAKDAPPVTSAKDAPPVTSATSGADVTAASKSPPAASSSNPPPVTSPTAVPDSSPQAERLLKEEFAALIAQGTVTPNQAAVMAVEKVRQTYRNKRPQE